MPYIIDGNNLAGKLGILFQDNFREELINIFKKFNQRRKRNILLVFDGLDRMGDKYKVDDNITVIDAPKDDFYRSADDKIVELVKDCINKKENVILITDDLEIIDEFKKIDTGIDIHYIKADDFSKKIKDSILVTDVNDKNFNKKEVEKLNDELLRLWK